MEQFSRITHNIDVMGGKACIKGTRVTVGTLVSLLGDGKTIEELLKDYPYIKKEDVAEALRYAAWSADGMGAELALA